MLASTLVAASLLGGTVAWDSTPGQHYPFADAEFERSELLGQPYRSVQWHQGYWWHAEGVAYLTDGQAYLGPGGAIGQDFSPESWDHLVGVDIGGDGYEAYVYAMHDSANNGYPWIDRTAPVVDGLADFTPYLGALWSEPDWLRLVIRNPGDEPLLIDSASATTSVAQNGVPEPTALALTAAAILLLGWRWIRK